MFSEIRREASILKDVDVPLTIEEDEEVIKKLVEKLRELSMKKIRCIAKYCTRYY